MAATNSRTAFITASTPSPKSAGAAKGPSAASAAPSDPVQTGYLQVEDPGPPPARPAQPIGTYGNAAADAIFTAAGQKKPAALLLDEVRGVDVFRQPAAVQQYKADVLHWIEAREAYRLAYGH